MIAMFAKKVVHELELQAAETTRVDTELESLVQHLCRLVSDKRATVCHQKQGWFRGKCVRPRTSINLCASCVSHPVSGDQRDAFCTETAS